MNKNFLLEATLACFTGLASAAKSAILSAIESKLSDN